MGPKFKYSYEDLKNIASKYQTVPEFRKNDYPAYQAAYYRGILGELIKDLERGGNKFKKIIYVYEFPDKTAYVGLTYNIKQRNADHLTNPYSQVFKYQQETRQKPELKTLSTFVPWDEASRLETEFEQKYRKDGWKLLNVAKTGGLGGAFQITDDFIKSEASKYNLLRDFRELSNSAYRAAYKRGKDFFEEVTQHMSRDKYSFSDEELEVLAGMFNTKSEFEHTERNAYKQAIARGRDFWDRITSHMQKGEKFDNMDDVIRFAKGFKSREELAQASPAAYQRLRRANMLQDLFGERMKKEWTMEKLFDEAGKYNSYTEFAKGSPKAYDWAVRNGYKDTIKDMFDSINDKSNLDEGLSDFIFKKLNIYPFKEWQKIVDGFLDSLDLKMETKINPYGKEEIHFSDENEKPLIKVGLGWDKDHNPIENMATIETRLVRKMENYIPQKGLIICILHWLRKKTGDKSIEKYQLN